MAYFNPPHEIRTIGRLLKSGTYPKLVAQLKKGEVLIGLFVNQVNALVATHIPSEARMIQMERLHHRDKYYAVPVDLANEGMDIPIPPKEVGRKKSR